MRIRTKITLPIIVTAVVVLLAASFYTYFFTIDILETEAVKHLETTAQLMKTQIKTTLTEQKEKVKIAATHGELSQEELQTILDISPEFYEMFVLDSEGIIINSTDESRVGLDRSNDIYFVNARDGAYVKPSYFSETTKKSTIAVSTPHAEGVLVARIDLKYFDVVTSNRIGLGETGENLLVYEAENGEPVFFTKRRFREEGLKSHLEEHGILPAEEALEKNEDTFFDFDYRHVPVIAVTKYIEEADIGLVVKIDQVEILASSREVLIFSIVRILVVLFIFFIVTYFIARKIGKPIKVLHRGIEIIEKGNLDHKVGTNSKDEIGVLSRAFDKMTVAIKESRLEIDKKVEEQTSEIIEKQNT